MSITSIQLFELNKNPEFLQALQSWKLVPVEYRCPNCSGLLTINSCKEEGWRWHCNNKISGRKQKAHRCDTRLSFGKGTFLRETILVIIIY